MSIGSVERSKALLAGLTLVLIGCHRAALPASQSGLDTRPTFTSEELFQVALFQARRGDLLRAEQYMSAARERGYDQALTTYWLVRVCVSAGRYHSALRHAAQRLHRNPGEWRLRLVVASIHEALGDLERAQNELEHVVHSRPGEPLPRYRLAMLYRENPDLRHRATKHLGQYLALDPEGAHAEEARAMLSSLSDSAPSPLPEISEPIREDPP